MSEERFDRMDDTLRQIGAQMTKHDARFDGIDGRIDTLDRQMHVLHRQTVERIDDVNHRMHVLHEDVMGAIRGIAEHRLVTEPELNTRLAAMQDPIERRLDLLEAAARRESRGKV